MRPRPVLLAALLALTTAAAAPAARPAPAPAPKAADAGAFTAPEFTMGNPHAKVRVVEYLSNTCSHCARFDAETFPAVKKQYIDTGKVRWTVREFLTGPEELALAGFVLARCAGRDRYWEVIEKLFRSQEALFKGAEPKTVYAGIARSVGMSDARFTACMADDSLYKGVNDRQQRAVDVDKIDGTPTFIVNGRRLDPGIKLAGRPFNGGELPLDQFRAAYAAAGGR